MENRVIAIVGCTAAGKGTLGRALARAIGAEIVSVDSMKVYRGMDIGTAKPPAAERAAVPHHLLDVADPWESFSAARFVELADHAVEQIHGRAKCLHGFRTIAASGKMSIEFGRHRGDAQGDVRQLIANIPAVHTGPLNKILQTLA